eukprot:g31523.t1
MSEPLAPEQTHGQRSCVRWDPCFNAPIGTCLAIILSVVCPVLIVYREDLPSASWIWVVLGAIMGFLGLWLLYASIAQGCRRRLRLGVWPVAEPDTLEKIIELCKGPNPAFAVGECWAYHTAIKYAQPEEKIIALGAFWSGVVSMSDDTVRVRTGMLWGEAPMDRPAFDQMSIGASVRVAAHGFFKDGWFIDYLRALQAVERGTGKVVEVKRGDYNFWEVAFGANYVLTEAEFETQQNRLVKVTGKSHATNANTTQQEVDAYVQAEALGSANVEIFVKTDHGFDWDKIALFLVKFHAQYNGRCDLRERKRNGFTITAFDFIVFPNDIPAVKDMAYSQLKIKSGSLHPGKYTVPDAGQIQLLDHAKFWIEAS